MKLPTLLVLISTICVQKSSAQAAISCFYSQSSVYKCDLSLDNPSGLDNFTSIAGVHLDGFSDASVELVEGFMQQSLNVPSVICDQFENVREIFIELSGVEVLIARSFENCHHLEVLYLGLNDIATIPEGTFANNPSLHTMALFGNRISEIQAGSFAGTALRSLELSRNQLTSLDNNWKVVIAGTIESLTLSQNQITNLEADTFSNLSRLVHLDISENPIAFLPPAVFEPLTSLRELIIDDTGIGAIESGWFATLTQLRELRMAHNAIELIPRSAFASLVNLTFIDIAHNRLTEINLHSFGQSIGGLTNIHADNNRISSIDAGLIDNAVNLLYLLLNENVCISRNFYNVDENRESVASELGQCFTDFGHVSCDFIESTSATMNVPQYICNLRIRNPTGRDTFDSISGDHLAERSDDDVTKVTGLLQLSSNIPSIFCRNFPNLRHFAMTFSEIQTFTAATFENCSHLETLELGYNSLTNIPSSAFASNRNLARIDFANNRLIEIGSNAFDNTLLSEIWLNNNALTVFEKEVFASVGDTLQGLILSNNLLLSLPENALTPLPHLIELQLDLNFNITISPSAFHGLSNLQILAINECNLRTIDNRWFSDLTRLQTLRLYDNYIVDLPANVFTSLTAIFQIDLAKNLIEVLPVDAFGGALDSLMILFMEFNHINFIDRRFIALSQTLNFLFLADNHCTSENILNLQVNREQVEETLAGCFRNYDGFVECDYQVGNGDAYTCNLTIANIRSRNDFDAIEGDHIADFNDDNVEVVTAIDQFTTIIPSLVCDTFRSVREIMVENSRLEVVDIRNCGNLRALRVGWNRVREVTAVGAENLEILVLNNNAIEAIDARSLSGTRLTEINLNFNRISTFDPEVFTPVNASLRRLFLQANLITSLPEDAFVDLRNLENLHISNNRLTTLDIRAFDGLSALETLSVQGNLIATLPLGIFAPLIALKDLRLQENVISTLPDGIFSSLTSLAALDLDNNDLHSIDIALFGESLGSLQYLFIQHNDIFAIDERLIANATSLEWLFAAGNICIDENFLAVNLERLRECFTNFVTPPVMACSYIDMGDDYACILTVFNAGGRVVFESIGGEHGEERDDSSVVSVYATNQHTRVFPRLLCETFINLRSVYVSGSRVRFLDREALADCTELRTLVMNFNQLTEIAARSFAGNVHLELLQMVSNDLRSVEVGAFEGSSLQSIDLSNNDLTTLDSAPFESVNRTLVVLHLSINYIADVTSIAFSNLRNLRTLSLNSNPLVDLPAAVFEPLTSLQSLALIDCQLTALNPQWLSTLTNLNSLHVAHNSFSELAAGVFENLLNVEVINVAANKLTVLDSASFGHALHTLESIYAYENAIDAIDRELLSDSWRINVLMLNDNVCVQRNFVNVRENRDEVREELRVCFENFDEN